MKITVLKLAGIDYDAAVQRFLGEAELYESLLTRFLEDTNFNELKTALEERNAQYAYEKAHTLKGISGNLSMVSLFNAVTPLASSLKSGDLENALGQFATVEVQYNAIVTALQRA